MQFLVFYPESHTWSLIFAQLFLLLLFLCSFFDTRHWIFVRTLNHQYDYTFDWTMLKQKAAQQAASTGGQGQQAQTPTGKQTDKPKSNMKG